MKSSKKECYFAGAYTRLSQDDGDKAESDSMRCISVLYIYVSQRKKMKRVTATN